MKKNTKKILLPILGFSAIAISVPIISTSCATTSNANIINFDNFKPSELENVKFYSFASGANDEWKSKSQDDVKSELNLTDSLVAGTLMNQNFRDEAKFKSIISGLTFSSQGGQSLSWTDINVSALNNPSAKVSLTYSNSGAANVMMINWELGSNIKVAFTLTGITIPMPTASSFKI